MKKNEPIHLHQIQLVTDIFEAIKKQAPIEGVYGYQLNAVCEAANMIVDAFKREFVPATPGMGVDAWLACDDTGLSSKFMCHVLCRPIGAECEWPRDAGDFGRCYRFLLAVPELRS